MDHNTWAALYARRDELQAEFDALGEQLKEHEKLTKRTKKDEAADAAQD